MQGLRNHLVQLLGDFDLLEGHAIQQLLHLLDLLELLLEGLLLLLLVFDELDLLHKLLLPGLQRGFELLDLDIEHSDVPEIAVTVNRHEPKLFREVLQVAGHS